MSSYNVCDDLMVQIFARLPPKSIIRFRSLSKYWHSRLLTPEFLNHHRLLRSKNPPKVIIRHVLGCSTTTHRVIYTLHSGNNNLSLFDGIVGVEFPYHRHARKALVIGSCNGILCLYNNKVLSLWNLSTRRKLVVPRRPSPRPPLETNSSNVALGFGFNPVTHDYNIVSVSYNTSSFIYSLTTDSWSAIPSPSTRLSNTYLRHKAKACFHKGILHWVGYGYKFKHQEGWSWTHFILTFNLNTRVFGYIWLPNPWIIEQVITVDGCLAVVSLEHWDIYGDEYSMIHVMKEYGNSKSWNSLIKLKADVFYGMTVFQPVMNGDILAYNREGSKVCNTRTMFANCLEFGPDCCALDVDTYVESLELVDNKRATACGNTVFSWR